ERARAGLDERAGGLHAAGLGEQVHRGGAKLRLGLLLEYVADALLDVGAQLRERLELARALRQLVVERRENLLLQLLERDRRVRGGAVGLRQFDLLRLAGLGARERALELLDQVARAELDDQIALTLAGLVECVDHEDVARVRRAAVDRGELGDGRAQ